MTMVFRVLLIVALLYFIISLFSDAQDIADRIKRGVPSAQSVSG